MARTQALDYDDKRNAILETASRIFAAHGFHSSSITDLATASKISKSSLYHYFDSKDQILFEILRNHAQTLIDMSEKIVNDPSLSAREKLLNYSKTLLKTNVHSREKHALILNELSALQPKHNREVSKMLRRPIEILFDILSELNPDLKNHRDLQFPSVMMFMGMVNWTHTWFSKHGPIPPDTFARIMCETFLNGFASVKLS